VEAHKLSTGEKISAGAAILLFAGMFLDWFGVKVSEAPGFSGGIEGVGGGLSAWDALDVIPIFLMLAIVLAVGVALIRLLDADLELSISLNAFVAAAGGLAVLLILYRIVVRPDFGIPGVAVDTTLKLGIFLGLVAAAGIAYGGWSAMREEGLSFDEVADRLEGSAAESRQGGSQNQ